MNTRFISEQALTAINHYLHFRIDQAECSIPYFNNRHTGLRAALPVLVGKGSPKQIFEEIEIEALKEKIPLTSFDNDTLKRFIIAHNIGIDCSGFAYFILNEESLARNKGTLDRHISFVYAHGIVSKIASRLNPVKNIDVKTLAHNKNSKVIEIKDAQPGDMITLIGSDTPSSTETFSERDHILIIHQIEYQNFVPVTLHYVNSIAWPSDGQYHHGVREGTITIVDINLPIAQQIWTESGTTDAQHYTHARSKSTGTITELRRLNYF